MFSLQKLLWRYWPDYLVWVLLMGLLQYLRTGVSGNQQALTPGTIEDSGFPRKNDTVPGWTISSVLWIVPLATIIVCGVPALKIQTFHKTHQLSFGFMIAYLFNGVVTNVLKLTVGRPRPSMLPICFPGMAAFNSSNQELFKIFQFSNTFEVLCTNDDESDVENGFKSFPSGHASYSATSGLFLTLYLIHIFKIFHENRGPGQAALTLVPLVLGLWIGVTRIHDYEHHPTDVCGGMIIGCAVASFFFSQALKSSVPNCDKEVSRGNFSRQEVTDDASLAQVGDL